MSLKVVVIGVGYLGKHHARIYSTLEGVDLVGVSDAFPEARDTIAKEYNTGAFADYRELLDKVDAVSIVTPTISHYDIASECLDAGLDIMLEKPITATVEEADKLIAKAENLGRIIQVGHLERFNPAVVALEGIVDKPRFIEAERLSPFQGRGTDVDITLDLMIHDINIVTDLMGGAAITDIRVTGGSVVTDTIDVAKAWMEFEGGAIALLTASRISGSKSRLLKVHEASGYAMLDYQEMKIKHYTTSGKEVSVKEIDIEPKEPLMEELADFVRCVNERAVPKVSAVDGRDALAVALSISEKIRKAGTHK